MENVLSEPVFLEINSYQGLKKSAYPGLCLPQTYLNILGDLKLRESLTSNCGTICNAWKGQFKPFHPSPSMHIWFFKGVLYGMCCAIPSVH